jgi:hypothetical protein
LDYFQHHTLECPWQPKEQDITDYGYKLGWFSQNIQLGIAQFWAKLLAQIRNVRFDPTSLQGLGFVECQIHSEIFVLLSCQSERAQEY